MKNVLFLVDDHKYGESAVDFCLNFLRDAKIKLVMVSDDPDRERLEKLSDKLSEAGNEVTTEVYKQGYAPAFRESKGVYDLVVFERKAGGFAEGILTGVGETILGPPVVRILAASKAPVLRIEKDHRELEKILILVDGSPGSIWAVEDGGTIAQLAEAEVTLLMVIPQIPVMYTGLDEMEEELDELLTTRTTEATTIRRAVRKLHRMGIKARLKIRHGDATDEIMAEIRSGYYDMVVLGTRRLYSRKKYIFGSVAQQVLHHTKIPLLFVKIG